MIKSMTGYGRAKSTIEDKNYIVEAKSVNHRNIEVVVRMPGVLIPLEVTVKKKISEKIFRGRVEVNIRAESDTGKTVEEKLEINLPLLRTYHSLLTQLKEEFDITDTITLATLANLRDAFYFEETETDTDAIWRELEHTVSTAVDSLLIMRTKEGEALHKDFVSRLDTVRTHLTTLKQRAPLVVIEYKKRLTERVQELADTLDIDEWRLSQEVAIMAEKSDITEEIVRLESHITQFEEMLESSEAVGRKMDFLLQEMHREINTIGSKSSDIDISHNVIEIKSELAKLREQTQNVE